MYSSERIDDIISKATAEELGINLALIEQIVRFQFKTANEATSNCTSVELTDLGVFKTAKSKVERKINTYYKKLEIKRRDSNNQELSDRKRKASLLTCRTIEENIGYLLNKKRDEI